MAGDGAPEGSEHRPRAARWEWSREELRRFGHEVVDLIADHLTSLPRQPVFRPYPNALARRRMEQPLPETGSEPDAILAELAGEIAPYPFGNGHPRFFGWVNGPPAAISVFAESLAAAIDPPAAGGNHAATYVEHQVLNWLKEITGFPRDAMGLLVSGGSMATLTALAVARHVATGGSVRREGLRGASPPLVVYTSDQGHSAIAKAVELLGIGSDALRTLPADADGRLPVDALERELEHDLAAGRLPMAVAASAGTVNTGAIDPLARIADLCDRHSVWLHIDGAYGAPAILDRRFAPQLAALARADSLSLDPHKWLYVPYEAGAVLVRDAAAMRATFSLVAPYLQVDPDPGGVTWLPWFSEYGFQQTRGFRALKVWMALRHHGRRGYAEAIGHDIDLAEHLAALVTGHPRLELVAHGLSVVCLRYVPAGEATGARDLDELNRSIMRDVQLGGEAFLTSAVVGGRFVLRACIVNPRSSCADVERLVDVVVASGEARRR